MTAEDDTRQLVAEIDGSLSVLANAVGDLSTRQAAQLRRTRLVLKWTIVGLVADLLLTLIGGVLFAQVQGNTHQLQKVNARVSTQALCPLYELFLRSYNPQSPVARQDPAEYERNFAVIEQGSRALGCVHVIRGH